MQLFEFPSAIANLQHVVRVAKHTRDMAESRLTSLKSRAEYAVAFDSDLKNDAQRKAKLAELMGTTDIEQAQIAFEAMQATVTEAEIELGLLLNEFGVAKLMERRAIATIEMQTATH